MKAKAARPERPRHSWRDIQQRGSPLKATRAARSRRLQLLLRAGMAVLLAGAIAAGILGLRYFSQMAAARAPAQPAGPVQLAFRSDGVLTEAWLREQFPGPLQGDLRQIDVRQLKEQLEREGQVAAAVVRVALPALLHIELLEREPLLRMRVRGTDGRPVTLLLARDGTPYVGACYPAETIRRLPGVTGVRLRREGGRYARIEGLGAVAALLDQARQRMPALYRHWRLVDLGDWNPAERHRPQLVRVRGTHIEELVFSTEGVGEQLDRLGSILAHSERRQMGLPKFIDLSFGDEAIIRYK